EETEAEIPVSQPTSPVEKDKKLLERQRAARRTARDRLAQDVDGAVRHAGRLVHLGEVAEPHLDHELVVAPEDAEGVEAEEARAGQDRDGARDRLPAPAAESSDQLRHAGRRQRQQGGNDLNPVAREDEEGDDGRAVDDHEPAEQAYLAAVPEPGD